MAMQNCREIGTMLLISDPFPHDHYHLLKSPFGVNPAEQMTHGRCLFVFAWGSEALIVISELRRVP